MISHVHAVLFDARRWTPSHAHRWCRSARLYPLGIPRRFETFVRAELRPLPAHHEVRVIGMDSGIAGVVGHDYRPDMQFGEMLKRKNEWAMFFLFERLLKAEAYAKARTA